MKKRQYLIIAIVAALALTACSAQPEPTASESTGPSDAAPQTPVSPVAPNTTPPESSVPAQDSTADMVLVDNENVCVKISGTEDDPIWGYTLNVYLENKTDRELLFTVDNVSINRYMCDPFWAESVAPGMKSNSSIYWFESSLEQNSISEVEEIQFTLRVYDANDFFADDIFLDSFTLTP